MIPARTGTSGFVTPDYFAAMKIPVRSGRVFYRPGPQGTQPVDGYRRNPRQAILARARTRSGNICVNGGPKTPWATIVGVVGHTKNSDLAGDVVKGRYYYPMLQQSFSFPFPTFVARTDAGPARLAGPFVRLSAPSIPSLAVSQIKLMSDMVSASLAPRRFVVTLLGCSPAWPC